MARGTLWTPPSLLAWQLPAMKTSARARGPNQPCALRARPSWASLSVREGCLCGGSGRRCCVAAAGRQVDKPNYRLYSCLMVIDKRNGAPGGETGASAASGGLYSDQQLRLSDAEREAVSGLLAEHFAAGRLDRAEFDDRVGRAMSAKTGPTCAGCSPACRRQGLRQDRSFRGVAAARLVAGRAGRGRRSSSGSTRPRGCRPTYSSSSRSSTRCGLATSSPATSCPRSGTWLPRWRSTRTRC